MDAATTRELLSNHGRCERQDASEWAGDFPLPDPLIRFYQEVGPMDITIEGYGNPTFIPSLAGLWKHQMGYRYHPTSGERFDDWKDHWIVVADLGADPYIYLDGEVLYDMHGTGRWDPGLLFPDLNTMGAALAIIGSVVVDAGEEFTDDDCYVRPEYRDRARRLLTEALKDESLAESALDNAGWG